MQIVMKMIEGVVLEGNDKKKTTISTINYIYYYIFRDFDDDDVIENFGAVTLQEVESRLIQLDPNIQDTMWYV